MSKGNIGLILVIGTLISVPFIANYLIRSERGNVKHRSCVCIDETCRSIWIEEALRLARKEFMARSYAQGVGINRARGEIIIIYVTTEADRAKVPPSFYGFPVIVRVSGSVKAL